MKTKITEALRLTYPLIVAPMGGGLSTPDLVIAASESGALGSMGSAYDSGKMILEMGNRIQDKMNKPIAINLFVPSNIPEVAKDKIQISIDKTKKYRDELHLAPPLLTPPYEEDFSAQFESVLKLKPEVFSFVFGVLPPECMKALKQKNIYIMGTATTLDEALALKESGVDAIIAQGVEAGGHRGIFNPKVNDPSIGALDLLKAIKGKATLPVAVAGGIMNAQDIKTMLGAGADAVQMGTAFLGTKEAGTSEAYRKELLKSSKRKTKLTRAFSGRLARGIENRFMREMEKMPEAILPFPAQNKFTRDLRKGSNEKGLSDFLSLWSGTGEGEIFTGSARELIEILFS